MMPRDMQAIEEELRKALKSHAFDDVARLVTSFCNAAEAYAKTLPPDHTDLRALASDVDHFLRWARLMTTTARSQWAAELNQVATIHRYLHSSPKDSTAVGLSA